MKFFKKEDGATIVLIAIMMSVFLGLLALVADVGNLYLEKAKIQKVADAAALAGAGELPLNQTQAQMMATKTIELNKENPSDFSIFIQNNSTTIEVIANKEVQLFFARTLGFENPVIRADASVDLMPVTSGVGAVPLGVEYSNSLQFGSEVKLKVADATYGNFGALALTGPGAKNYETDLENGYGFEIKVGDVLNTETGAMAGKTYTAVTKRIQACPNQTYLDYSDDCKRLILVPVFKPILIDNAKQVKQVEVVGFATFFIKNVTSTSSNAEVIGTFIQTTYPGSISSTQKSYGTYGYKLTK
ncbi:pilus assembly protein TadG-related protein [Bacillus sp. JJ1533]|uniref:pilus assembly protein TadG-related protein n=1 Tax=Bacillus sp. JJ1533 TaxID=3122959 RepID=UPI003000CA1F